MLKYLISNNFIIIYEFNNSTKQYMQVADFDSIEELQASTYKLTKSDLDFLIAYKSKTKFLAA